MDGEKEGGREGGKVGKLDRGVEGGLEGRADGRSKGGLEGRADGRQRQRQFEFLKLLHAFFFGSNCGLGIRNSSLYRRKPNYWSVCYATPFLNCCHRKASNAFDESVTYS